MVNMGQYIPGRSPVHRIDPRVKIGSLMVLSILVLKGESITMGLITTFLMGLLPISHLSVHHVAKALKPMSFFLLLLFILHLFFTHGTPIPPFPPWSVTVTYEGLHKGVMVTWQFALLLLIASMLTMTTSPAEIICAIEKMLRPFKKIGIPSHDIAIMVSIALRFVPTILQEMDRIKEAQMARGARFQTGTWGQRLRAMKFLVLPLILRSLRRGDELATAMEGRGYRRGPRTYMRELRLSRIDYVSMLAMILLIGLCISLLTGLPSKAFCETPGNSYLLDRALEAIATDRGDVGMRTDLSTNPFALSLFTRWMAEPLKAPIEAQHIAETLFPLADRPERWLSELARSGDIFNTAPLPFKRYTGHIPSGLPKELVEALHCILNAMSAADEKISTIRKSIPPLEMDLIERYLYPEPYTEKAPEKVKEDFVRTNTLKEAIHATTGIDRKGILEAGMTILKAMTEAKSLLLAGDKKWHREVPSLSFMTDLGLVEIGGIGSDVHEKDAVLIIDLGGNDLYRGKCASGIGKCAVVLDLSGDDTYLGEDLTQGSGFWGIGILWDLSGNDLYKARDCSQGAGLFGVGLLVDEAGDDRYMGERFVQAASSWGWGGLIDLSGDDLYQCRHSGQAYAEVLGISCLCDLKGHDRYISGASSPDPREPDMNQSFSQGFAMGMRNLAAGGFALLSDQSGNDLYECQYFGQGASYWMGIGILYDENGKDTYIARRYAQGAGIHYSLGLLMDVEGDDHTVSWGVSQGCGHDYGVGILINERGDDTYVSNWLSAGASEANGVGIFVDNWGNDGYETNTGVAVGRLIEDRRAGGVGLFIDAQGKDRYSQKGMNNHIWAPNRWAVGIDWDKDGMSGLNLLPSGSTTTGTEEAEAKRLEESVRLLERIEISKAMPFPGKVEGLLAVASHWGFDKETPEKAKEELIDLSPVESVPAMADLLGTPDVMSLMFMDRFFTVHAFYALPELIKKTKTTDSLVQAMAYHYLGRLRDSRSLGICVEALEQPDWRVRSSAIRAIGETLSRKRLEILEPMMAIFHDALQKGSLPILEEYLEKDDNKMAVLSVLTRAVPLSYSTYSAYAKKASGREAPSKEDVSLVYDHLSDMIPLLERWIRDIHDPTDTAMKLMVHLNDPHPSVKRAAAYALGQMGYEPAIPQLLTLLKNNHLWVRDAAVLSLALFEDKAIGPLLSAMAGEGPSFRILGLDILSRIGNDRSKEAVKTYLTDPDENVKRVARQALGLSEAP